MGQMMHVPSFAGNQEAHLGDDGGYSEEELLEIGASVVRGEYDTEEDSLSGEIGATMRERRAARSRGLGNRLIRRGNRLDPRPVKKPVPTRDTQINIEATGTAGEISNFYELQADCYLDVVAFNDSSAGSKLLRIEAGDMILWKSNGEGGMPCSAFTTSSNLPFSLKGIKLKKGVKLEIRGRVANDNDKISAIFFARQAVSSFGGCSN